MNKRVLGALLALTTLAGCGTGAASTDTVAVVIGYQSKTINTVTAGTLLRAQGFFERRLAELGKKTGKAYEAVLLGDRVVVLGAGEVDVQREAILAAVLS